MLPCIFFRVFPYQSEKAARLESFVSLRTVYSGDAGFKIAKSLFRIGAGFNDGEQKLLFRIAAIEKAIHGERLRGEENGNMMIV